MEFAINNRIIGSNHPPYLIAELSGNHNGSLKRALETIRAAKESGVDAVKLQTYTPDTMTIDCDSSDFVVRGGLWDGSKLYDLYESAHTPYEWHVQLFEYAKKCGITVFSTPFDESAVDLLEDLGTPAYKIASFEMVDLPLVRYVARTGKPLIISTGMASEQEIEEALDVVRQEGCANVALLHCISSYPAPTSQANLRQIPAMFRRFGVPIGLSDHTLGTAVSCASIALGACFIEKHFTLSRTDKGPDSAFSIEPEELEFLCSTAREIWSALGNEDFSRPACESSSLVFRRSIYFVRDLPAQAVVGRNDIRRIRPGMGLSPKHFDSLVGRKLRIAVRRGTPTDFDLFED